MTQLDLVPRDYTEMHKLWFPFMVNLVGRSGIDMNNREDVATDIFIRIMEWDILGTFNPSIVFHCQDGEHPARFKNFLSSVVLTYVRGHRDRQIRMHRREIRPLRADLAEYFNIDKSSDDSNIVRALPTAQDHSDLIVEAVMEEQTAANVRALLSKIPKRSNLDTCDLPRLFDAVREQAHQTGAYDVHQLAEMFGVSLPTIYVWVRWLRANLADIYGVTLPTRRTRRSPRKSSR